MTWVDYETAEGRVPLEKELDKMRFMGTTAARAAVDAHFARVASGRTLPTDVKQIDARVAAVSAGTVVALPAAVSPAASATGRPGR